MKIFRLKLGANRGEVRGQRSRVGERGGEVN